MVMHGPAQPVIQLVLFDGVDELDVFGPFEPLASAGFEVRLVTLGGPRSVVTQRGVQVRSEADLTAAGGVVVPGGGWLNRAARGAWAEAHTGELGEVVRHLAPRLPFVASVCSGAMILAHAGLLRGRRATTNPGCFPDLRPWVGVVESARVVEDGDIITAGALSCGLDLGVRLVRRLGGAELAEQVVRSLALSWLVPEGSR